MPSATILDNALTVQGRAKSFGIACEGCGTFQAIHNTITGPGLAAPGYAGVNIRASVTGDDFLHAYVHNNLIRSWGGYGVRMAGSDMTAPVTRGELREELAQLETRFDQKLEGLEMRFDQKLEGLEGRFDHKLEMWGGALLARIESGERRLIEATAQRTSSEIARHARALEESIAVRIAVIDEKYADLPGRVSRLEAQVVLPGSR